MKIRCLIVDDEPIAIKIIHSYIDKIPNTEVIAECKNALEANHVLKSKSIDLIFLDINMPEISGIEFLKTLSNPPRVIITTAYREFAVEGFELDVIDYLVKPISFERFLKAINRFSPQENITFPTGTNGDKETTNKYLYLNEGRKVHKVNLNDILFVEGMKDYIRVHLRNKKITIKEYIGKIEEKLPSQKFLRIHKSYIVAINEIDSFTANTVEVGNKELPIGRTYKRTVLALLNPPVNL